MIHEESPDTSSSLPKTVLVLGASSLVGDYLLPLLARAGYEVHALSRKPQPAQSSNSAFGIQWHIADVDKFQELAALPGCANVISLLPLWKLPFAADILRARGMRRLLAFSSTSALTKANSPDDAERALAERLRAAENALWELNRTGAEDVAKIALTLFRPTLIYDGSRDRNVTRIARILTRHGILPLPGKGEGLRQPVHAEDLAIAALQALVTPDSHDRCYELGGGETLTYRAMVERIALALSRRVRILSLPSPFFALARAALFLLRPPSPLSRLFPRLASISPEALRRINQDMTFDWSAAARDFNYTPRAFHPEFPWQNRTKAKKRI